MRKPTLSTLTRGLIALTAVSAILPSAQAAVFAGDWDPVVGGIFPDVGWKGTATFFVPDACLASSGWVANSAGCSGFGMQVQSATVSFYNATVDPLGTNVLGSVSIYPPSMSVLEMEITGGLLTGVNATFSSLVSVAPFNLDGMGSYSVALAFFRGSSVAAANTTGAALYYAQGAASAPSCGVSNSTQGCAAGIPQVHYTVVGVPEPQTYALMLMGLAGIGAMASRRRKVVFGE